MNLRKRSFGLVVVSCVLACGGDSGSDGSSFGSADGDSSQSGGSSTASSTAEGSGSVSATGEESGTAGTMTMTGVDESATSASSTNGSSDETSASASATETGTASASSGESDSGSATSVGTDSSDSGGETGMEICDCAENTDLIYVLSDDAELWSFDPMTNQFAMISAFNCNNKFTTFSMAVDRKGVAWVMFQPSADLYTIDVNNPNVCDDPGYNPGQMGFNLFGMAFVSESEVNPCDQLYGHTYDGIGGFAEGVNIGDLGVIDPATLMLDQLGDTNYNGAELTGTGDGRLYAFGGVNPAKLIEFDKTDASVLETLPLPGVELTNAFAFAFWGGDFYFFTEGDVNAAASEVNHIDYDDSDMNGMQDLTEIVDGGPIRIVGAGVSTCAPLVPQ